MSSHRRDRLSTRDLLQPAHAHDVPHASQRDGLDLALAGVAVQPTHADGRHRPPPAAAFSSAHDGDENHNNPWSSSAPRPAAAGRAVSADPHASPAGRASRGSADRHARMARSPPRSYAEQNARAAAPASPGFSFSRASASSSPTASVKRRPTSAVPSSPSSVAASNAAASPEPRSEEERFERWKKGLHEYFGAAPPLSGEEKHAAADSAAPARGRSAYPSSANGSARVTPSGSPHESPARRKPFSASAARGTTGPPSSLARSLASLHKKVRGGSAGAARNANTSNTDGGAGSTFDRLSHGLPSHALTSEQSAIDPRQSLENIEAAFIAKLQAWQPVEPADHTDGPQARAGAGTKSAAASKMRRNGAPTAMPAADSSLSSEEQAIRDRAQALAADMASLARKKRVALLADAAAQCRIQARLQLEARESSMRAQLDVRMRECHDAKDSSVQGCLSLQADVRRQMAALRAVDEQLSGRIVSVERAHASALDELKREYAQSMESLYASAASQLESQLRDISEDGGRSDAPSTNTKASAAGAHAHRHLE